MWDKLEDWFLNKLLGKLVARGVVALVAYLGAQQLPVTLDPAELTALATAGAHALFELVKSWRTKKKTPEAPKAA